MNRVLAIGDIHGHTQVLNALIDFVSPTEEDLLVFLGDYVDKGPDTKGVLSRLVEFPHRSIFLRGNHDQMLLDAYEDPGKVGIWQCLAGESPLASYGIGDVVDLLGQIPEQHWQFLKEKCVNYHQTASHIFVHAGLRPHLDPADEEIERLQWSTLDLAAAHYSGRTVVCGHSAQRTGQIADLGHTVCIDTAVSHGGWLTCLSVESGEFWQANGERRCRHGKLRESD